MLQSQTLFFGVLRSQLLFTLCRILFSNLVLLNFFFFPFEGRTPFDFFFASAGAQSPIKKTKMKLQYTILCTQGSLREIPTSHSENPNLPLRCKVEHRDATNLEMKPRHEHKDEIQGQKHTMVRQTALDKWRSRTPFERDKQKRTSDPDG